MNLKYTFDNGVSVAFSDIENISYNPKDKLYSLKHTGGYIVLDEETAANVYEACKEYDQVKTISKDDFVKKDAMFREAVEKQIPKAVIADEIGYPHCPRCGGDHWSITYDFLDKYAYCSACGQRLDWSKEDTRSKEDRT